MMDAMSNLVTPDDNTPKIFQALADGPQTSAAIAKKLKGVNQDEVEDTLHTWRSQRLWVSSYPKGNTEMWEATDVGRSWHKANYGN